MKSIEEVFRWLGKDSRGVPYHLHLLNLRWSPEGQSHDLKRYAELADELSPTPELISMLIRGDNWRYTLLGNAVAIMLQNPRYVDDLVWRLLHDTWVAPQVAVGIALVSKIPSNLPLEHALERAMHSCFPEPSLELSQEFLVDPPDEEMQDAMESLNTAWERIALERQRSEPECDAKTVLSAYAALKFFNNPVAQRFERSPAFSRYMTHDPDQCVAIATTQWEFWRTFQTPGKKGTTEACNH